MSVPQVQLREVIIDRITEMDAATPALIEQLALDVQSRLGGRVRNLRLLVQGTGLILRGEANTYHAKQLVQHAILEESGMPLLANKMEVIRRSQCDQNRTYAPVGGFDGWQSASFPVESKAAHACERTSS
jgi:hypothetical protein